MKKTVKQLQAFYESLSNDEIKTEIKLMQDLEFEEYVDKQEIRLELQICSSILNQRGVK